MTPSPTKPVYAIPAGDVGDEAVFFLRDAPVQESDYQTLYNSPVAQLANDVLIAWASGEISEGRAAEILRVDRERLRSMRMDALGRVTGDVNEEAREARAEEALDQLNVVVATVAEETHNLPTEIALLKFFWQKLLNRPDFLVAFEQWRALCPVAQEQQE